MAKLSALAERSDFRLGPISISPGQRRVTGPAGEIQAQPLVFQAFLLLLDARGRVVTRDELFNKCWGKTIVGDDSLNRLISGVREIASRTSPELFEVERIPRTGYRLIGSILSYDEKRADGPARNYVARRAVTLGALAAASATGLWAIRRTATEKRFDDLIDRAQEAIRYGHPYNAAVGHLEKAVAMRPKNARAHGLLAYAQCMNAEQGDNRLAATAVQDAELAVAAALALDSNEPNARLAKTLLERSTLDLEATERRLRGILRTDPANTAAMKHLWDLLQSTGQSLAAWAVNEKATAIHPLAAAYNFPRAQLLWILGRNAEADRVIDRAMGFWPGHQGVRFARLTIYAFTNRPRAALHMLDNENTRPQNFTSAMTSIWRAALLALDQRSPRTVGEARSSIVEAVNNKPALALPAAFLLSALNKVDDAFGIANQFLLFERGIERPARPWGKSRGWRFTPWLFIPPTKPMRLDPRFKTLCEGIGLTEYWSKRGIGPDEFLMRP